MPTRAELFEKVVDGFIKYATDNSFPYLGDEKKVEEYRKKYPTEQLMAIAEKMLLPPFNSGGEEGLKTYLEKEFVTICCAAVIDGDTSINNFVVTEKHKDRVLKDALTLIKIVTAPKKQ